MKRFAFLSIVSTALFTASPARADLMFFSPLGIASETYGGPTHPVPVGTDGLRLSYHGGGDKNLLDPILLILGIPTGLAAPTLTLGAMDNEVTASGLTLGGTNVYSGIWGTATGFAGTFTSAGNAYTSAPNPKVYDFIHLFEPGNDSQSYTNWSTYGGGNTSWDLYVWSLSFTPDMNSTDPDWVEFTGALPVGTFAIAYGCQTLNSDGTCGSVQSTPFTRAGYAVPEPSSLVLTFAGLGLVLATTRKRARA